MFAAAREHFLIPKGVAYCNTGTLGASLRKRVRVRVQNDERGVRLSAHVYVSPADADAVLGVTREVAGRA